jgi:HEAT repeat protein
VNDHATLLERIGDSDRGAQRKACDEVAARLNDEPELRTQVVDLLRHGSTLARFGAAFALLQQGPTLRVLPALLDALELDDGDLRWTAAHLLASLGRRQGEVLPVLLHEARHADSARRRRMALYAVRELAPEHPTTEQTFMDALSDEDPDVRRAALSSAAKLREPRLASLERAVDILAADPDPRMRRIAAVVLPPLVAHHSEHLQTVRAALQEASSASDPDLARAAQLALQRLDSTGA